MDPDQVPAAAGVHHDGLDEASASAGGGDEEGWARALLRRGWDLSRKAAIAGAAATAAPVVAPPILILSVAGVALSVPFAACLASLAATDRLMAALLPPCRPTEPYHAYDQEDDEWEEQEFLDAAEAPDNGAPAFHHYWSRTEEDAVEEEEDESAPLLPLSREPRVSEEPPPVPMSTGKEGVMAKGDLTGQESGHEPFVADIGEQKEHTTTVDSEFITMEALPKGSEFPGSAAPALYDDDNLAQRTVEATIAAQQSVQEPSVSDSGDKTEDVKCKTIEEDESTMKMLCPELDVSKVPVPMLGNEDIAIQHEEEDDFIDKLGHDSLVSSQDDRTEDRKMEDKNTEMPPRDIDVSESLAQDDRAVHSKTGDEVTVEMVPKEVTSRIDPVAGDVVDVRMDVIAITQPECEPLPPNDLVVCELQAITEAAYDENARRRTVTEDIVRDLGYTNTEGLEHCGEGPAASVVKAHDGENVKSSTSTTTTYVPAINDGMMSDESRPAVNLHHQITDVENMRTKDGFGEKPISEDRYVKTEERKTMDDNMALQELAVSGSPIVQDNTVQRKRDDELTVEMVVEEVASITALVTDEVVDVNMDVTTTGSASRPHSNLAAHVPTEVAIVDDTQGSTLIENIVTNTSDPNTMEGVTNTSDPNTLEGVEHHGEEGVCSSVLKTCVVSLDDGGDLMSSESTTFVSAIRDDVSVESRPDVDHPHQTAGVQYPEMNERFGKVESEDEDIYTEERLREELDTIRTITGYRAVPSSPLEGELTGLYSFVGVEPPVITKDVPDLAELSAKLRFLKSIIGVE